jgi:hypothetical protein
VPQSIFVSATTSKKEWPRSENSFRDEYARMNWGSG